MRRGLEAASVASRNERDDGGGGSRRSGLSDGNGNGNGSGNGSGNDNGNGNGNTVHAGIAEDAEQRGAKCVRV